MCKVTPRHEEEAYRLHKRLAGIVATDDIPAWLETPNGAFDGLKPLDVTERRHVDRRWNRMFYLEPGAAS
jgi:hypothetical protein